jgi:hypothetical protein
VRPESYGESFSRDEWIDIEETTMPELTSQQEPALHRVEEEVEALRGEVQALLTETHYEDLEHADIGSLEEAAERYE